MPSGEYNCGNRPLKTARSKPDNTPLTTSAKRCKKTFIGAPVLQKVGFVTLLSGTRDTDFQDPGGLAAMCLCGSKWVGLPPRASTCCLWGCCLALLSPPDLMPDRLQP